MVDVLYAHQDGEVTGSAISLRNLLAALDRDKFTPRVALFSDGPARELYESIGVRVDVITARPFWTSPGSSWTKLGFYYNFIALLPNKNWNQYLKEYRPDLVHVNDKSCLHAGVSGRKHGVPVVWHLRSSYAPSKSRLQAKISAGMIRKNASALIAISEDETDGFDCFANLHVVHNSLDFASVEKALPQREPIRTELGVCKDDILVGLVSTQINHVRGAWDFIEMAGRASKLTRASLKFVIVARTTDDAVAQARTLAQQYGISDRLILTGFRSDALAIISALDILVVCNHHGVLGRPPFEAMAVGKPIAAWQGHSRRSSVVSEGETALLAPRGDVDALAQQVTRLVNEAPLRLKMGENGIRYAREHFDPNRNARLVEHIYHEVLNMEL